MSTDFLLYNFLCTILVVCVSTKTNLSFKIGVTACVCSDIGYSVVLTVMQCQTFLVRGSERVLQQQLCIDSGRDWDFSARLRERQHIRMLHSIKALQG